MKTIILIILSFITLNAQSRMIIFSSNPAGVVSVPYHYQTNLTAWWFDSTLTNGSVTSWEDLPGTANLVLWNDDTTKRAIMTSNGLVFQSDDWYYASAPVLDGALSVGVVVDLPDTTTDCMLVGANNGDALTISIFTSTGSNGRLSVRAYDGSTTYRSKYYALPLLEGTTPHYVLATHDGAGSVKLYIDGVLQTERSTIAEAYLTQSGYMSVNSDGQGLYQATAGVIYRAGEIYETELTQPQAEQNYNYYADYYGW